MFADIGKFFEKNIIKPIDKAIVKPIDKAIVQPIREATDKDYALRHEHARIAALEKSNEAFRPKFFQAQQDLATAQSEYERVSEDFTSAHGAIQFDDFVQRRRLVVMRRVDFRPSVVKAIEDGGRSVLGVVSFGLSEAIFNKTEIPEERAFLRNKINLLQREGDQLRRAVAEISEAVTELDAARQEIEAEHARLGADVTASDVHVLTARDAARASIIQRLLADGVPVARITEMTGFDPDSVAEVAQSISQKEDA